MLAVLSLVCFKKKTEEVEHGADIMKRLGGSVMSCVILFTKMDRSDQPHPVRFRERVTKLSYGHEEMWSEIRAIKLKLT